MTKNVEVRLFTGLEVRQSPASKRGIEGYTAVFESDSQDLGGFIERIEAGAFAEAMERSDPVALFNHNADLILGRLGAGTLELEENDRGLFYAVPELPASRGDVLEAVQRGDVAGNSFAFIVDTDRWEKRDGEHVRIIEKFSRLIDVGPVVHPAYLDTVVSARALHTLADRVKAPEAEVRARLEAAWDARRRAIALALAEGGNR